MICSKSSTLCFVKQRAHNLILASHSVNGITLNAFVNEASIEFGGKGLG
jgi:hypothetical protein